MTDDRKDRFRVLDRYYGDEENPFDAEPGPDVPRASRAKDDPRHKHRINVNEQDLKMLTSRAWTALTYFNDPPYLFANGNTPVRIVGGANGVPTTSEDLTVDTLSRESANTAYWMKLLDKGRVMQPQYPPERVMRNMLAESDPGRFLKQLKRITNAPMFGPNGELETTPGYQPTTGHWYAANGLDVAPVSKAPTRVEVEAALDLLLNELLGDFPFVGRAEIAHALSLMINPFVRDLIDGPTPLYGVESPTAGTGKGLLVALCLLPALGRPPMTMTQAENSEEERKRITSTLIALPEAVLIDNIAERIDSPNLASVLTLREWSDRVLGQSKNRTIPVRNTWVATGNNPSKSSEMARRIIRIRIDAKAERPEQRRAFRHPRIERWAKEHRARLVHAVLTLVQAWVADGMPRSHHTLGSYDEWASVHGGILQVADVHGFLENMTDDRLMTVADDAAWETFVAEWWKDHRDRAVGVSELFKIAQKIDEFPLGQSPSERGQRTAFGMAMSRNRNRIFGGKEVVFDRHDHKAAMYRLRDTEELPDF